LDQISDGREKVKKEIQDLKDKLNLARETIEKFKTALTATKNTDQTQTPTAAAPSTSSTATTASATVPATPALSIQTQSAPSNVH